VFSLESIYIRSKNAKNTSLIVFIIGVILLDGVIILMLSIIITRPLKRLTNAAKQITKGDFDINIKCKSKDEIGFLSNSFVEMSREIKQNFAEIEEKNREIKDYNEHLEDMVKSRTKELDEANKKLIEEEEALIRFTTELNEQTMSIGKIEKELDIKMNY
jgi:methyl-accepting chemotaxis protein